MLLFLGQLWIIIHLIGFVPAYMYYSYLLAIVLSLFVPIEGRSGPSQNPEILIAIIISGFGLLMFGLLIPLFSMITKPIWLMTMFVFFFIVSVIITATDIGFPYREALSAQRMWIFVRFFSTNRILCQSLWVYYLAHRKNFS